MRKFYAFLMLAVLLFGSITPLLAQEKVTVSGIVSDSKAAVVLGATVVEKGTRNGVLTDETGHYRISVSPNATLVVSYVGYVSKEVKLTGNTTVNVTLAEDQRALKEVVVSTGYGDRTKRSTGFATTTVSGDDIRRTAAVNPISALQGMVPGLQVSPNAGGPQASVRFQIRGSASLDPYGNQPLIVVDDIVMDDQVVIHNRGGDQDFGNVLKDINPDDIESVNILKGGAVTALYGSRASNGVIVIKTKKGFSQKGLGVTLSHTMMWEQAYKTVKQQNRFGAGVNTEDWGNVNDTLVISDDYYTNFGPEMKGQMFRDYNGVYRANNPGVNNPLDLYRTGMTRNTNIGINGGNDKTTFRFSYSNMGSQSATPNNNMDRNSFAFRATHRPSKAVLLDVNTSYTQSKSLNPAFQGESAIMYATSYSVPRNYDLNYWLKNYIDTARGGVNPLDPTNATEQFWKVFENRYEQREANFRAGLNMRADLTEWLRFDGTASINDLQTNYTGKERGTGVGFAGGNYAVRNSGIRQYRYRGSLSVIKKVNDFDILFQGGAEMNQSNGVNVYMKTRGLVIPDFYRISNSAGTVEINEGKPNRSETGSLFFQGSIAYKNYLTLNLYGRNDWNSTLVYPDGHGDYSYFYPGADLAFVISDLVPVTGLDFVKLRASYVEAGGGTFPYNTSTGAFTAYDSYRDNTGALIIRYGYLGSALGNANLIPVRNAKFETGLEFKLLRNRLGGDFTFYTQDSKNQIQDFNVEPTSGVRSALTNGGKVRNVGIELQLFGTPVKTKDFSWDVLVNYTRNRNKIMSLALGAKYQMLDGGDGIYSVAEAGGDYGAIRGGYGYAYYQATDGSGNPVKSNLNGLPLLSLSTNGSGTYFGDPVVFYRRAQSYNPTVGKESDPVMGSTLPKFLGSLRNTFNYKRFSLSAFLDAKIGGDVYSNTYGYGSQYGVIAHTLYGRNAELGGLPYTSTSAGQPGQRNDGIIPNGVFGPGTNLPASASADGQAHDLSGMTAQQAYDAGYLKPTPAADYYNLTYGWGNGIRQASMFESSWVSLREVSLSYDMPLDLVNKLKLNGLRATIIGRNLGFLYNSAPDDVNPDNLSSTSSGAFMERGGTPYFRQFGFSLNATF
ncbi:SusC/RagA family TonB-linked outer membrane protein [Chitinophaga horti]|uniref:SusC/RagA family TonB-linked outer membrane protein n=1 Tax=Chitinophaga horti TaxID=2920382 RepID=A0ABY6JA67_9BACT|nr:SusC/RagA family TonB-linked outer membrane protein [Chitinophaga horti]UYQ95452.1 SusC/RagA family TonB-linked outer membrane protein [Chitinophaga horti]